jgi:uncharacterized protein (DUF2225 family)
MRLQPRSAQCPVCQHGFEYGVLLSTNAAGGVETDFRARAVGMDPVPFTVLTCPRCSYCADTGTFEQPVKPAIAYQLKGLVDQLLTERPVRDSRRFHLAAELLDLAGGEGLDVGWMYLRASWMARDEKDTDAEALYQRRAVETFQKYLDANEHALDAGQVTYLVGELARRLGDFETACANLGRVSRSEKLYPTAQKMLARAREHDASSARFGEQ